MSADTTPPGLLRVGGVVVLSGPAAQAALDAVKIATRTLKANGWENSLYADLALALRDAVAASGQTVIGETPDVPPSVLRPMPIAEAAEALGKSHRQTRRLAPKLGGQRVGRSWLVDRQAVEEHLAGRQQIWTG
jgi:hypothetical protein